MLMKVLINLILATLLLSSCKNDREYIKDQYFSRQAQQDLETNRNDLYRQSYVGVYSYIDAEEVKPQK